MARNIRRVLDDNSYYSFCSEKKVVHYIGSVAVDADKGANDFLRSYSYLQIGMSFSFVPVERETRLELATTCLEGRDSTN